MDLVIEAGSGQAAVALGRRDLRDGLVAALTSLPAGVSFVLIRGAVAAAFAGPDLPQAEDAASPTLSDLCAAIEACPVPVGILLEGTASGRGAEVYLAAHLRLAVPAARVVFSSVSFGQVPGAGATQRLPRLVGAEHALRLMRAARPVPAAEALAIGLIDQVLDQSEEPEVLATARAALRAMAAPRPSLARTEGFRDGRAYLAAIAAARKEGSDPATRSKAEAALIDCVEAALLLPADQGLSFAQTLGTEIAQSAEAAALTHIYRAELRAAQIPAALSQFEARLVRHLGVAGADPALAGLVLTALSRGASVTLVEPQRDRLVAFLQTVAARQEAAVKAGQMTATQRDADWARLSPVVDASALGAADLILAQPEVVLPALAKTVPVLTTGRGALAVGAYRLVLTGRVAELGLPASSVGPVALTAWAFLRRMGLHVVLTGQQSAIGIAGRLAAAGGAALRGLVDMGVPPDAVRAALRAFGQSLNGLAPAQDVPPRPMEDAEICQRWLAALANEAARLMQAGLTSTPGDIDLVAVAGLGFPRHRGGPLHQADQRGLLILRRDLMQWQADAPVWVPVAALDALVSLGRGFAGAIRTE
ncbi:enoyl-CoA hydratase-related protein [Pseudotabrizicola sp. L79]|uniref:enoyl-CoA hydratase-related protein n=1 Tax=Pseudotabrizicola sp. L79 TaxID=3118402 RepID=UPI002F93E4E7